MRTQTLNNNTFASDPGSITLSERKLRRLHPELFEKAGLLGRLDMPTAQQKYWLLHCREHLMNGDSRAALVVSTAPLLVAAYTDELDCVALLGFPSEMVAEYQLQPGTRLLTVNTYVRGTGAVPDLENGPAAYHHYSNFSPFIAEFLSDDAARIAYRKAQIAEPEWVRAWQMAQAYLARHSVRCRDGRPTRCSQPAW